MKSLLQRIIQRILPYETRVEWSLLRNYYSFRTETTAIIKPCVIFSLDSRFESNGLADRMRGMISTFAYCKASGLSFKIDHQKPFYFNEYLVPASYDWTIKEEEISHSILLSRPIYCMDRSNPKRLFKIINRKLQYHVYTNIDCLELINHSFGKQYTFSGLFNELFKPSQSLEKVLNNNLHAIGTEYFSISFRFMQLLGDFKDVRGKVLSDIEKKKLVIKSLECVKSIQKDNNDISCLVTADSSLFLNEVSLLPNVYVAPGKVGHIGHTNGNDVFLKTFLDFYLVANASKVYLAYSDLMYSESLFAKTASRVNNRPFVKFSY